MGKVIEYVRRNLARIIDIVEAVVKVVEKVLNALVEIVPLTPTTKDDDLIKTVQNLTGVVRKGLDTARNFFFGKVN